MITESKKRKRINTVNKNKTNYARMLANFRTNRMKRTVRVNMIADKVGKKKEQEAPVNTHTRSHSPQASTKYSMRIYWGNSR